MQNEEKALVVRETVRQALFWNEVALSFRRIRSISGPRCGRQVSNYYDLDGTYEPCGKASIYSSICCDDQRCEEHALESLEEDVGTVAYYLDKIKAGVRQLTLRGISVSELAARFALVDTEDPEDIEDEEELTPKECELAHTYDAE